MSIHSISSNHTPPPSLDEVSQLKSGLSALDLADGISRRMQNAKDILIVCSYCSNEATEAIKGANSAVIDLLDQLEVLQGNLQQQAGIGGGHNHG